MPPTYSVEPSGDTVIDRMLPSMFGANDTGSPVEASNAAMWLTATSPVPSGLPGGRIDVKSPPAYSTPCAVASAHTDAFVCHMERFAAFSVPPSIACATGICSTIGTATAATSAYIARRYLNRVDLLFESRGGGAPTESLAQGPGSPI